jgi:hypothetical protein
MLPGLGLLLVLLVQLHAFHSVLVLGVPMTAEEVETEVVEAWPATEDDSGRVAGVAAPEPAADDGAVDAEVEAVPV